MSGLEFNWSEFFNMGGYAVYVWPSYGLALIMVIFNVVSPKIQKRKTIARIKRAMKRESL